MEPSQIESGQPYHRASIPVTGLRRGAALVAAAILLPAVASCGPEPDPPADSSGDPALRVIAISPELAVLLSELGVGAQIVGADSRSQALPAFRNAVDLGEPCKIDVEASRVLQPDLAVVLGTACGRALATELEGRGLVVRVLDPRSLNEVVAVQHRLGALFGRELRARAVVARMTREISRVATTRDGRSRLRVVWLLDREPLVAVGAFGVLHEMLELAGAENAFHEPAEERIAVTRAEIAARAPDLVLDSSGGENADPLLLPPHLRVERIPRELSSVPALDLLPRIERLHRTLYPESRTGGGLDQPPTGVGP